MKLGSLFNLVTDAQDVLDLFEGVENVDQLHGRLRRINQIEADDLLTCLASLQVSIAKALDDTLEMNPDLDEPEEEDAMPGDSPEEELPNVDGSDEPAGNGQE